MEALPALLTAIPWVLLWLGAGIWAAIKWNKHPVVSALVVTGAVLHLLTTVGSHVLPLMLAHRSLSSMALFSGAISIVGLVGSVCIVAAVFVGRRDGDVAA